MNNNAIILLKVDPQLDEEIKCVCVCGSKSTSVVAFPSHRRIIPYAIPAMQLLKAKNSLICGINFPLQHPSFSWLLSIHRTYSPPPKLQTSLSSNLQLRNFPAKDFVSMLRVLNVKSYHNKTYTHLFYEKSDGSKLCIIQFWFRECSFLQATNSSLDP